METKPFFFAGFRRIFFLVLVSNYINDSYFFLRDSFKEMRWILLYVIASPAVVCNFAETSWIKITKIVSTVLFVFALIFFVDATALLAFDSNQIFDVLGLHREDRIRPSWTFNPHPFSRTLIAYLIFLFGALSYLSEKPFRIMVITTIFLLSILLVMGGVRTAFISLVVISFVGLIFHRLKFSWFVCIFGIFLATTGLFLRQSQIFDLERDSSLHIRMSVFKEGIAMISKEPWFGWGFRGIRNIEWSPESLNLLGISANDWINTHVQWMESTVSYGIPGGIFLS